LRAWKCGMHVGKRSLPAGGIITAVVFSMVLLGGCGDDSYDGPKYVVTGEVWHKPFLAMMHGASFAVREAPGGECLPGAIVTVNDTPCPWNGVDLGYVCGLLSISPGDAIVVEVELGGFHSIAFLTMPSPAICSAPTGSHDAASPILVEWSTSFVPGRFTIFIDNEYTVLSGGMSAVVDGAATSCEIPPGTLKPATNDIMIGITAVNETADLGPYAGSGSWLRANDYNVSPAFSTQ